MGGKHKGLSILLTLAVILLLIVSGPTSAITVTVSAESTKQISFTNLPNVQINATIDIDTNEHVPLTGIMIIIKDSGDDEVVNCHMHLNGTPVSGNNSACSTISVDDYSINSNSSSGDGWGYGYGFKGGAAARRNTTFGVGYGYGHVTGTYQDSELFYVFNWSITGFAPGAYTADVRARAEGSGNIVDYAATSLPGITITGESASAPNINPAVDAGFNATTGFYNITATNVSSLNGSIKAVLESISSLDSSSNISIITNTSGIGDVNNSDLPSGSEGFNIFFNITATISGSSSTVNFMLPKSIVDSLTSTPASDSRIKVYVKHSGGDIEHLNTSYQSSDSSFYTYSMTVTSFSVFAPYYAAAPASSAPSTSGGGSLGSGRAGGGEAAPEIYSIPFIEEGEEYTGLTAKTSLVFESGGETYTLTIRRVSAFSGKVRFVLSPLDAGFTLAAGEEKEVIIPGADETFYIKLTRVRNGKIDLFIKKIMKDEPPALEPVEDVPEEESGPPEEKTAEKPGMGAAVPAEAALPEEKIKLGISLWIIILVAALAVFFLLYMRRKGRNKQHAGL